MGGKCLRSTFMYAGRRCGAAMGAAMAGCDEPMMSAPSRYGRAIGEACQLRDDLLGVVGATDVTGKPSDGALAPRKATAVVVAARRYAEPAARVEFDALLAAPFLEGAAVERLRELIIASGACDRVEAMISDCLSEARHAVRTAALPDSACCLLDGLGVICGARRQ
ncbi:polyprenyl synthetase family protein [Nocardia miyunensis]|uniref:polyprenyl synthetase family protein n=1 Tax=Nocardia miyunensis TaxID=282684 RepID=UPI0009FC73A9|nr:polyprenyl synthetase family protein [Nocardia miyunensis]